MKKPTPRQTGGSQETSASTPMPDGSRTRATRWNLRQIQCFVALADMLHFGRAAERMHMTQPAFSRQIKHLEEGLGFRLVDRDSQKVKLTPAGEAFVQGSGEALTVLDNAVTRASLFDQGLAGTIRIGYTDFAISSALPQLLRGFKQAYPEVVLEPFQGSTRDLLTKLRERRLDIAFATGPIFEEGLASAQVTRNKLLVVLYESHPLAAKPAISLSDLAGEDFVFGNPALWQHFLRHIDRVFDQAQFQPHVAETAFNSEGLFGLVAGQFGITLYPDCVLNYHRLGLVFRPLSDLETAIPTDAVWRKDDPSQILWNFRRVLNVKPGPRGRT